jgi:hypothetical protein
MRDPRAADRVKHSNIGAQYIQPFGASGFELMRRERPLTTILANTYLRILTTLEGWTQIALQFESGARQLSRYANDGRTQPPRITASLRPAT